VAITIVIPVAHRSAARLIGSQMDRRCVWGSSAAPGAENSLSKTRECGDPALKLSEPPPTWNWNGHLVETQKIFHWACSARKAVDVWKKFGRNARLGQQAAQGFQVESHTPFRPRVQQPAVARRCAAACRMPSLLQVETPRASLTCPFRHTQSSPPSPAAWLPGGDAALKHSSHLDFSIMLQMKTTGLGRLAGKDRRVKLHGKARYPRS